MRRLLQKQCTVIKYWTGTINNINEVVLATTKYDEINEIVKKLKLNIISKETKTLYYYAKTLV
jgi:hypothetical protein